MKVLFINGSPKKKGSTYTALNIIEKELINNDIEVEYVHVPSDIVSCTACNYCHGHEGCIKKDLVNEVYGLLDECDGIVIGTPVYYAGPSGSLMAFLDRLFYSYPNKKTLNLKAGAAISNSRRAGNITSNDVINKFFSISGMPIITSTYWNDSHGNSPEEVLKDEEAIQTLSNLGKNLVYYLKAMQLAKDNNLEKPEINRKIYTNFIR